MGGGSNGDGDRGSNDAINNNDIPPSDGWKTTPDYWKYYRSDFSKNKKKLPEQCDLDENSQDAARPVTEKLDESNDVKKLVKTALKNQDVKNEYVRIKKRLEEGINPVDIGKKSTPVASNKVLIKGDEGRYLLKFRGIRLMFLGFVPVVIVKTLKLLKV